MWNSSLRNGREIFADGIHGAESAVPSLAWVFPNLRLGEWQGGGGEAASCPREQKTGVYFLDVVIFFKKKILKM